MFYYCFAAIPPHFGAVNMPSQHIPLSPDIAMVETKIEDGKLLYERRW